MNSLKKNPVIILTLAGLFLSFGAPIGFYIHDFMFNGSPYEDILSHITHLNQTKIVTLIYIGFGTSIFFSFFGFMMGHLLKGVFAREDQLISLQISKNKLFTQILSEMRTPIGFGLESLTYLKSASITASEKDSLVQKSIERLKDIDDSIAAILSVGASRSKNFKKLNHNEVINHLINFAQKNDINFNNLIPQETAQKNINLNSPVLVQILTIIGNWTESSEMKVNAIWIEIFNQSELKIFITLDNPVNVYDDDFNVQLLEHLIDPFGAKLIIETNKIEVLFVYEETMDSSTKDAA